MKHYTLAFSIAALSLFGGTQNSYAQDSGIKVGIKVSPGIAMGRVIDKDSKDGVGFSSNGSAFAFSFGPQFDFPVLKQNVYFTTGVWFSIKSIKVTSNAIGIVSGSSKYNLQYITVPLAFKFYTNEIAPDIRLYFTLGGTLDVKISEGVSGDDDAGLKTASQDDGKKLFLPVDGNLLLGTGVQFKVGETTLFAGVSYLRGLVNVINPNLTWGSDDDKPTNHVALKNNTLNLDLGIEF